VSRHSAWPSACRSSRSWSDRLTSETRGSPFSAVRRRRRLFAIIARSACSSSSNCHSQTLAYSSSEREGCEHHRGRWRSPGASSFDRSDRYGSAAAEGSRAGPVRRSTVMRDERCESRAPRGRAGAATAASGGTGPTAAPSRASRSACGFGRCPQSPPPCPRRWACRSASPARAAGSWEIRSSFTARLRDTCCARRLAFRQPTPSGARAGGFSPCGHR
jgi:hypothetical protein